MANALPPIWNPRGAWEGILTPGRHGRADGKPGVRVIPLEGLVLASVVACDGYRDQAAQHLSSAVGAEVANAPHCTFGTDGTLIGTGPGQWLFVTTAQEAVDHLAQALAGTAAVFNQADARAVLRLSGAHARDVLAKGCALDLHPRAFKTGDAAVTAISHIGVSLWQVDEEPAFDLAVPRSMAGSFWSWLASSSAAYGCDVMKTAWVGA
jgi:sarcosine oxidase subunit gamma